MIESVINPSRGRLVIFDDEPSMGRILVKTLIMEGYEATHFANPVEGLVALRELQPDVLLTDIRMPQMSGIQVAERMRRDFPNIPVLAITAFGTVEGAVEALQAGVFNYITKPFEPGNLLAQINRALEHRRMYKDHIRSKEYVGTRETREIVGQSESIRQLRGIIARSAPTDSSVLITGRSGVGKELVARAIHAQSPRATRPFVVINCPSIPSSLIESIVFGHERGAFTGADCRKIGLIESAHGGTIFLDEVAELPLEMQVKFLRVLQEREIQRIGGLKHIPIDIRIIAATNRDFAVEIPAGRFREDLYYRLKVIQIETPPLSARLEDLALLTDHILERIGRRMMKPGLRLTDAARQALAAYNWPGNVRELENVLEQAVVFSQSSIIDIENRAMIELPRSYNYIEPTPNNFSMGPAAPSEFPIANIREARMQFEHDYFKALIEHTNGNISRAAEVCGISRRALYSKIEKMGLKNAVKESRS